MDDEHNRARYRRGCRCDACRAANREYQREHRAKALRLAPPLPESPVSPMGRVEAAVQRDLDALPLAAERPGLAQATLAMARLLDNPLAAPQHPAAARQLFSALEKLGRDVRVRRRGYLAAVRAM